MRVVHKSLIKMKSLAFTHNIIFITTLGSKIQCRHMHLIFQLFQRHKLHASTTSQQRVFGLVVENWCKCNITKSFEGFFLGNKF